MSVLMSDRITPAQMRSLHARGRELGLDHDDLRSLMQSRWRRKKSLAELTQAEFRVFLDSLRSRPGTQRRSKQHPNGRLPRSQRDDIIRPATERQKRFIQSLLDRLFPRSPHINPERRREAVRAFVLGRLGENLAWPEGQPNDDALAALADLPITTATAHHLIDGCIAELKRRGLWR